MSGDLWLLQWREGSATFHAQKLADVVAENRRRFVEGDRGWVPLAVGSADEVGAFADALRPTMLARCSETRPANSNSGHGHVFVRSDGVKARCGGPGICPACSADQAQAARARSEGRQS